MKDNFNILIGLALIALIAPTVAQLPQDSLIANGGSVGQLPYASMVNPINSGYVRGNLVFIDLSKINPAIFNTAAFSKEPGGMSSGDLYTTSVNDFLKSGINGGISNVPMKPVKVGLVHWPSQ